MEDKIKGLIENISSKTKKRETNWERVGRSEQFTLTLDNGMITMNKLSTKSGTVVYLMSIVNSNGDKIFSVNGIKKEVFSNEPTDYEILREFHEEISKAYFKVDETIDGLLNEIQKEGEIGKEGDGLPF